MRSQERKNLDRSLFFQGSRIAIEQYGSTKKVEKVILFCHGFPGTSRLGKLAEALKNEPISLVEINYRGDPKSRGKFSFLGSKKDILEVANYLRVCYDSVPLHALGYSMGAFYVVNLLSCKPKIFDKAILLNPVVNTQTFFSDKILMAELWGYAKNLSLYKPNFYEREIVEINKNYNPVNNARWLKTPISIVQSTADEVLNPVNAKRFFDELKCKKEYAWIPGAPHELMGNEKELREAIIE